MKKISVQFKELNWEKSKAENKPIYDIDSEVVVVASTKSENNYIDELTKSRPERGGKNKKNKGD